jgi:hypothetical protein
MECIRSWDIPFAKGLLCGHRAVRDSAGVANLATLTDERDRHRLGARAVAAQRAASRV